MATEKVGSDREISAPPQCEVDNSTAAYLKWKVVDLEHHGTTC